MENYKGYLNHWAICRGCDKKIFCEHVSNEIKTRRRLRTPEKKIEICDHCIEEIYKEFPFLRPQEKYENN